MQKTEIAIIGRVAKGTALCDGQTQKTRELQDALQKTFPGAHIRCVDTYKYSRHVLPILWQTLCAFAACPHIFVLLSRNGRTFFFPLITALNKIFKRQLYHDVIGGALPTEAAERPALQKQLRRFRVNWVETPEMKAQLEALGVDNAEVLPNFKQLEIAAPDAVQMWADHTGAFVFATFSRVLREKGIGIAAAAVAAANRVRGEKCAVLRIYGPIEDAYRTEFDALLREYADCVTYEGCIPSKESGRVLGDCFMLLFPTTYCGEGMPGTLIDAYAVGLPVIASDWHFNASFVEDGVTGWIYPADKPECLSDRVLYAVEHPGEVDGMRMACLERARCYLPEAAMKTVAAKMREQNPKVGS